MVELRKELLVSMCVPLCRRAGIRLANALTLASPYQRDIDVLHWSNAFATRTYWLLGALAVAACAEPTAPLEPTFAYTCDTTVGPNLGEDQQALLNSLPRRGRLTIDDEWADIARQVPGGWGGYFFDLEDGTYTTYLVDPSKRDEATAALLDFGIDIRQARVKQGLWDFAQLYDWDRYIRIRLNESFALQFPSKSINRALNRLVYGAPDVDTGDSLGTFLSSLALPCDLLVIRLEPPIIVVGA